MFPLPASKFDAGDPRVRKEGRLSFLSLSWAFAEFTEVYQIEADFKAKVEGAFDKMIKSVTDAESQDAA